MNEKRRGNDASCQIWSQLRQIYGKWPPPYFLLGSHLSQGARELNTHKLALFPFSSGSALWPSGAKHSILAAQKAPFCLQPTSIECNLLFSVYFPQELLYITHKMTSFHFVEPHEVWELFAVPPTTFHTQKAPRHKSRREEMKMITLLLPNVANGRI